MNLFLRRIIIFFVPIAILLFAMEYGIRQIPNSYKTKAAYLKLNVNTIETLVLGSSHTFYAVNPAYFTTKTFNASNVSQSPSIDYAILKSYEDMFTNLKTVIIRLSYDTLFEQLKNTSEDWRLKNYKLYTTVDLDYTFRHNFELMSLGTRQSLKVLKNYYVDHKSLLNCDSLGWGNDLGGKPKLDLEEVGLIVAKKHTAKSWELLDKNIANFNFIIEWCYKRDINVIIVTPPAYSSYVNNLDEKQLNKMIATGKRLDKNYSNCRYYNFLEYKTFEAEDFYDGDHLNENGAKKFSHIINALISP